MDERFALDIPALVTVSPDGAGAKRQLHRPPITRPQPTSDQTESRAGKPRLRGRVHWLC